MVLVPEEMMEWRKVSQGGEGWDRGRQVLNVQGSWLEADTGKCHTDLNEEECSIGIRVAADVNPSQDDGRYQEDSKHDAHHGTQVHRRTLGLWGRVVWKACGDRRIEKGFRNKTS